MKRFQQMTKAMGNAGMEMPSKKTLVLNPSHNLVKNAFKLADSKKDLSEKICHHIQDLAAISGEGLTDDKRKDFVHRSQDLISELSNLAL